LLVKSLKIRGGISISTNHPEHIGRVIDGEADIVAMAIVLYSVPSVLDNVNALAVMPGLGEFWRIKHAITVWEKSTASHLLIAGHNHHEKFWRNLDIDTLTKPPFHLRRVGGVRVEARADHTKAQADWLVANIQELNITSLALFVSPYHLLRAYCTVLKAFYRLNVRPIPMIPMSVAISPDTLVPETETNAWGMIPGEVKRIIAYQEKGDVATLTELQQYISLIWKTYPDLSSLNESNSSSI
jgi:hypothetical protein